MARTWGVTTRQTKTTWTLPRAGRCACPHGHGTKRSRESTARAASATKSPGKMQGPLEAPVLRKTKPTMQLTPPSSAHPREPPSDPIPRETTCGELGKGAPGTTPATTFPQSPSPASEAGPARPGCLAPTNMPTTWAGSWGWTKAKHVRPTPPTTKPPPPKCPPRCVVARGPRHLPAPRCVELAANAPRPRSCGIRRAALAEDAPKSPRLRQPAPTPPNRQFEPLRAPSAFRAFFVHPRRPTSAWSTRAKRVDSTARLDLRMSPGPTRLGRARHPIPPPPQAPAQILGFHPAPSLRQLPATCTASWPKPLASTLADRPKIHARSPPLDWSEKARTFAALRRTRVW